MLHILLLCYTDQCQGDCLDCCCVKPDNSAGPRRAHVQLTIFNVPVPDEDGAPDAPMLLIGDIDGDGLGCVSWWDDNKDDDDDDDGEMQE